jgi:hypothetical protein
MLGINVSERVADDPRSTARRFLRRTNCSLRLRNLRSAMRAAAVSSRCHRVVKVLWPEYSRKRRAQGYCE